MKLVSVTASPFVRKVRVLILELGLQDTVILQDAGAVTPVSNNTDLNATIDQRHPCSNGKGATAK
jgi:glutathione S-transferase